MLTSSMKSPVWENKSTEKEENEKLYIQGSCRKLKKNILRWYGTPCNIYKEERILNYDYNHGLKNSK